MRRSRSTWLALLSSLVVLLPGAANALGQGSTITITLDGGTYDPNPPPGITGTPTVFESGAIYEGFWFEQAGTPNAYHGVSHTHVNWSPLKQSLIDRPHSWREGMQGVRISLEDGGTFRLVSLEYRVGQRLPADGEDPNSQFARLPWTTPWQQVQLLLSTSPDPVTPDFASFEAQWTALDIGDDTQLDLGGGLFDPYRPSDDSPWRTLLFTGLENLTEIYIGHTGSVVAFDNIVIERTDGAALPEPGTAVLVAVGLGLLAARQRATSRR